jgi:hypothetical protein
LSSVYDGQHHVGSVETVPGGVIAYDVNGQKLGTYPTRQQAVAVVLRHARDPIEPDAEAELSAAVESFMGSGTP